LRTLQVLVDQRQSGVDAVNAVKESDVLRVSTLDAFYALGRRIRTSSTKAELDEIEKEIDRVLQTQRATQAAGEEQAREVVALNVAAHRLENLIHDQRLALASQHAEEPQEQARA
jgi:TATA-binding protein-associated factor Taf7